MMTRHAASWPGKDLSPRRLKITSHYQYQVGETKLTRSEEECNKDEINAWGW